MIIRTSRLACIHNSFLTFTELELCLLSPFLPPFKVSLSYQVFLWTVFLVPNFITLTAVMVTIVLLSNHNMTPWFFHVRKTTISSHFCLWKKLVITEMSREVEIDYFNLSKWKDFNFKGSYIYGKIDEGSSKEKKIATLTVWQHI